jgi:hypothetical protein
VDRLKPDDAGFSQTLMGNFSLHIQRWGRPTTKSPGAVGARVEIAFEQTESPLAFFSVVAISQAPKHPKSFHVGSSLSRPVA